jgi:hypothetical protein
MITLALTENPIAISIIFFVVAFVMLLTELAPNFRKV